MAEFKIEVDNRDVIAALSGAADHIGGRVKEQASHVTADRIAVEARGRVARRTGQTQAGIVVEETHDGEGYVVLVRHPTKPGLPRWLEFGTSKMSARPFLFASAHLEEAPHARRVEDAVLVAIKETGLGE